MATPYVFLTTVINKENSSAGASIVADQNSNLYFSGIPAQNNDRFNPLLSLGTGGDPSIYSNVNYALIQWPDELEPRRYYVNYKNVTVDNTITLGLNQDYLATFATFLDSQQILVKEATQPNTLTTETHNIGIDTDIPTDADKDYSIKVNATSPFISITNDSTVYYGGGVVVFGTALEEVTNYVPDNREKPKGLWFAKINNVKYYAITLASFAQLVQFIYDKLLSLDNDKGKYDQLQSAIREVLYYPLNESFLAADESPTRSYLVPKYTLPIGYTRNNDGTVSYSDGVTTRTVKLIASSNNKIFQLNTQDPTQNPSHEGVDMHIDSNGYILNTTGTGYFDSYAVVFQLPHVFDASPDEIAANLVLVNFKPDTDVMNKTQLAFSPYITKIEFEHVTQETAALASVFRNGPRALNLEPLTTLTMSCGPFGIVSIPLEKVYTYVTESTLHKIHLYFEMILDVLTGDAILRIFSDYLTGTTVREKLAELRANIACTLAMETIANNDVTWLTIGAKALTTIAAGAGGGLGAAIHMGASQVITNTQTTTRENAARLVTPAEAYENTNSETVTTTETRPDNSVNKPALYTRGTLLGLGAGAIAAGVSALQQSRDVNRTYTKFSGWLDYCRENWFLDFHYKTPMFNDPDVYPNLYPVYKNMRLLDCRGHLIKGSLFTPRMLVADSCLVPTKNELNSIRELLDMGVWLDHTTIWYNYSVGSGITLTDVESGITWEGPTVLHVSARYATGRKFTANKDITINDGEPIFTGTQFSYPLYNATIAEVIIPDECTATIADDITIAQYIGDTATGTTYTDGTFTLPIDIVDPEQGGPTTYNYRCSVSTTWNETVVEANTGFTPENLVEYDVVKYVAMVELVITGSSTDKCQIEVISSSSQQTGYLDNGTYSVSDDTVVKLYYYSSGGGRYYSVYNVTQDDVTTRYSSNTVTINIDQDTTISRYVATGW